MTYLSLEVLSLLISVNVYTFSTNRDTDSNCCQPLSANVKRLELMNPGELILGCVSSRGLAYIFGLYFVSIACLYSKVDTGKYWPLCSKQPNQHIHIHLPPMHSNRCLSMQGAYFGMDAYGIFHVVIQELGD